MRFGESVPSTIVAAAVAIDGGSAGATLLSLVVEVEGVEEVVENGALAYLQRSVALDFEVRLGTPGRRQLGLGLTDPSALWPARINILHPNLQGKVIPPIARLTKVLAASRGLLRSLRLSHRYALRAEEMTAKKRWISPRKKAKKPACKQTSGLNFK